MNFFNSEREREGKKKEKKRRNLPKKRGDP